MKLLLRNKLLKVSLPTKRSLKRKRKLNRLKNKSKDRDKETAVQTISNMSYNYKPKFKNNKPRYFNLGKESNNLRINSKLIIMWKINKFRFFVSTAVKMYLATITNRYILTHKTEIHNFFSDKIILNLKLVLEANVSF